MAAPRHDLSVSTPGGGFYDQVVGMSQGIINKSFKEMFDTVMRTDKTVCKLFLSTKKDGTLNAQLDAPSVVLMGNASQMVEVWYVLRIKSGMAELKSGKNVDLTGWTFAVNTPLKKVTLTPSNEDPPGLRAEKELAMQTFGAKYNGFKPGDYRVQRIFCALAEAGWTEPDGYWSRAVRDGVKVPLSEWQKDNEGDSKNLLDLLRQWAQKQRDERISSLGINFELRETEAKAPEPTFKPVKIQTQVYPYRTTQHPSGQNDYGDYGPGCTLVEADYNCLLYCEMVHSGNAENPFLPNFKTRDIPSQPRINWSSNFAQPQSQGEEIPGTFAMDRRVWLEAFVLPQLQELCMATKLTCGAGICTQGDTYSMRGTYAIGCPLSGESSIKASDSSFAFRYITDGHYQWQATSAAPNNGNVHEYYTTWYQPNRFNQFEYKSTNEVNVRWDPGTTKFKVDGSILYEFDTRFANDRGMSRDVNYKRYKVKGIWNFDINIQDPQDSLMKLEVDRSKFKQVDGYWVPEGFKVWEYDYEYKSVTGTSMEAIRGDLSETVSRGITRAEKNIADRFSTAGVFTFPGHGALKYRKPMLTSQGNLVAIAEYASTNPDGTVAFPDPTLAAIQPPSQPEPLTSQFPEAKMDLGKPRLVWTMDFKYDEASKNGRISFTGTNETSNEPLRFDYIRVLFVPQQGIDTRLFPSREWKPESQSWIAKAISAIRDFTTEDLLSWFRHDEEEPQKETTGTPAGTQAAQAAQGDDEGGRRPKKKGEEAAAGGSTGDGTPSAGRVKRIRDDNVYGFGVSHNWTGVSDLTMEVESTTNLGLDALLSRPGDDNPFTVARKESVTIILQGKVPGPGNYQIKVQEEWAAAPGNDKSTQEETASWDWKMVQIFNDGRKPDYFDISDKAEEIERERAKAG